MVRFVGRWLVILRLEWKPQDLWVGAFWRTSRGRLDVWVCPLPMVPVHLSLWFPTRVR